MTDTLLQKLEELNSAHFDEGRAIMKAFGGTFYPFNLLAYAVLNRSISLTRTDGRAPSRYAPKKIRTIGTYESQP